MAAADLSAGCRVVRFHLDVHHVPDGRDGAVLVAHGELITGWSHDVVGQRRVNGVLGEPGNGVV